MRFSITGHWNASFEHDGMLYCAQRIEEMLMVYTSHLYKVPVYSTFLLAYEFMTVYQTVETKSIDKAHLKNIMDEFVHSFSSDIVIKDHMPQEKIEYFVSRLTGASLPEQRRTMHYLIHVMSDYPKWCIESLKRVVSNPKQKKSIEKALRSYIPTIIWMGYHPQCIYKECKRVFRNNKAVDNLNVLDSFLNRFNGEDKDYVVYFSVDKSVEEFRSILESRLAVSFEQDNYSKKLKIDMSNQTCVHLQVSALDVNSAAKIAYETFDLFMRYYRFLGNRDREWCSENCLVKDIDDHISSPHIGSERYFYSQNFDNKTLGQKSERILTELIKHAGGNDFFTIDKIIRTHNTALSNIDINNAFLNLWSVLEIVGISEFEGETTKIKQILNNIVPVLKRNYVNRVVEELHDYLKANLKPDEYNELMDSINESGSDEYKIACLISLHEYEEVRKKTYEMLSDFPLIRSRISQLFEDVFKKKRKLVDELNRYGQRLTWHIQRLYRVRNSIIHSGQSDNNMVSLVEHLHSYVDEVVLDIIDRMTRPQSLGTVANILLDAQLFVDTINKECANDEAFNANDIKKLIQ